MTLTAAVLMTTIAVAAPAPAASTASDRPSTVTTSPAVSTPADTPRPQPPAPRPASDPRHRMEVRVGGWTDGWYGYETGWDGRDWGTTGQAQGAFGLEYLSFLRNDLAIGIGVSGLASADNHWGVLDQSEKAQATIAIPIVVRWYPVRRITQVRSLEPYVTAGIGPVFGVDSQVNGLDIDDWNWRRHGGTSTRVATGAGGRVGGGVDLRLGRIFTLGLAGAWNWDAGLPDDLWRGARPNGGEFTAVLGWTW
jgi:hypothetical protein